MLYLAEKVGKFYPQDMRGKYAVTEWLIWQMANQGPKLGECGHFRRLGDKQGDQTYAVRRFTDEVNRLYGVMNNRLYESKYLAGDRIHDRRHDLLSVDGELERRKARTSRNSSTSSAGSKRSLLARRCSAAWRWGRTCRRTRRNCRRRNRNGARRCCTTSALGLFPPSRTP